MWGWMLSKRSDETLKFIKDSLLTRSGVNHPNGNFLTAICRYSNIAACNFQIKSPIYRCTSEIMKEEKKLLSYVVSHLIFNSSLEYPYWFSHLNDPSKHLLLCSFFSLSEQLKAQRPVTNCSFRPVLFVKGNNRSIANSGPRYNNNALCFWMKAHWRTAQKAAWILTRGAGFLWRYCAERSR